MSPHEPSVEGALGVSEAMRQVEMLLRRVADIDSSLMFTGEYGVGKEVVARFVHQISTRQGAVHYVQLRCDPQCTDRKRTVRLRVGSLHQRSGAPSRQCRAGPQWHPVSRRGR
jgi:type II secretory pathway predicted ATPase ExeA